MKWRWENAEKQQKNLLPRVKRRKKVTLSREQFKYASKSDKKKQS